MSGIELQNRLWLCEEGFGEFEWPVPSNSSNVRQVSTSPFGSRVTSGQLFNFHKPQLLCKTRAIIMSVSLSPVDGKYENS